MASNEVSVTAFERIEKQIGSFLLVHLEQIRSGAETEFRVGIHNVLEAHDIHSIEDPRVAEIVAAVKRARDRFCKQNGVGKKPEILLQHSLPKKV